MRAARPSRLASHAAAAGAALVLFTVAALSVAAQDPDGEPGCVEANPCDLIIAVDEAGFADISETEFTHMDWLVATIVNHDDVEHTISLSSHDLALSVPAGDLEDSDPFRINGPGTYTLSDQPTGDTVTFTSLEEEEFDDGDGDDDSNGTPGLAPTLLLATLVALAIVARRTR